MTPKNQIFHYYWLYLIPIFLFIIGMGLHFTYGQYFVSFNPINGYFVVGGVSAGAIIITFVISLIIHGIKRNKVYVKYLKRLFAVMFILALVFMSFGSYYIYFYLVAQKYDTGPILMWAPEQDPTREITILWRTRTSQPSIAFYGESKIQLNNSITVSGDREWHQIQISNLNPNQTYYYSINTNQTVATYYFTTAPIEDKNFTFFIMSDSRQNDAPLSNLFQPNVPKYMAKILQTDPNIVNYAFTITAGDMISEGDNDATWKSWFDDISKRTTLASYAPVQVVIGNHERHSDWNASQFEKTYPIPNRPNFYYSFNYSNVHIQILDPWNTTAKWWGELDNAQIEWMELDMARNINKTFKIVVLHPPPVRENQTLSNLAPLVEMCDKYRVDAVFYGHDHSFEINKINNTNYYLIGIGGALSSEESGFTQLNITPDQLEIQIQWVNGTTQSLTTITK